MNKTVGLKKTWYTDGVIKEVYYTSGNKKHGEYKKFSKDGHVITSCHYVSGKINGELNKIEGEWSHRFEYRNGKRHGVQFVYDEGKLAKKYYCINGKLHGEYVIYDDNEVIMVACNYINDLLGGEFSLYRNGQRLWRLHFKKDKLHGDCIQYSAKTYILAHFREGEPIKKWKEIDQNGKTLKTYVSSKLLAKSLFNYRIFNLST